MKRRGFLASLAAFLPFMGIAGLSRRDAGATVAFTIEDVALCDLLLFTEKAFGPSVGNWLTESSRADLAHLRERIARSTPDTVPTGWVHSESLVDADRRHAEAVARSPLVSL
jgi:hypothetical protein